MRSSPPRPPLELPASATPWAKTDIGPTGKGEVVVSGMADGFAGAVKEPGRAAFRPVGLAEGPALPVPAGATEAQVVLGSRIFHGKVASGTCAGCRGSDAKGGPIGADLTAGTWIWSDGSLVGITKTVTEGVATPKQDGGAMPPMGGSPLTPADLQAVSAYVWALGHAEP